MAVPKRKADESGEDRSGRKTAPIQVDKDLARMIATIASHDGKTQAELITSVLRQFIKTHYERVQKEMQERARRVNQSE